jgi:hypothetical protein
MATMMSLTVTDLAKSQAASLRRRANRKGLTEAAYVRELIEEDAELDSIAASKTFAELAAPFRKALAGATDADLDALARPPKRKGRR